MTTITVGRAVGLTDAAGRDIGSLRVEEQQGDRLLGTFTPGADYPAVEPLFRYFEELVEQQCLSLIDEADAAIQTIGPRLADGTPVCDVQLYSDGGASFRLTDWADRNGAHPAAG